MRVAGEGGRQVCRGDPDDVIRVARPSSRRRRVSITVPANTCAMARNGAHPTAFSKRDRVGCEAKSGLAIGSRSISNLWIASLASGTSLQSA
jgi:hypothetical protein